MSDIIKYPDPRLRQRCEPITSFDSPAPKALSAYWSELYFAMKAAGGIGLAGPQLGIMKRIVVVAMEVGNFPDDSLVMINPLISIPLKTRSETMVEGCLSLPGVEGPVSRAAQIRVDFCDVFGTRRTMEADGVLARCIQHEVDHLNGVLFTDRMSKRNLAAVSWPGWCKDMLKEVNEALVAQALAEEEPR